MHGYKMNAPVDACISRPPLGLFTVRVFRNKVNSFTWLLAETARDEARRVQFAAAAVLASNFTFSKPADAQHVNCPPSTTISVFNLRVRHYLLPTQGL